MYCYMQWIECLVIEKCWKSWLETNFFISYGRDFQTKHNDIETWMWFALNEHDTFQIVSLNSTLIVNSKYWMAEASVKVREIMLKKPVKLYQIL